MPGVSVRLGVNARDPVNGVVMVHLLQHGAGKVQALDLMPVVFEGIAGGKITPIDCIFAFPLPRCRLVAP